MAQAMRAGMVAGAKVAALAAALWTAPAFADTIAVTIGNVAYAPAKISARVGDTIVWTNDDIVAHTATARDKSWDVNILPKKTGTLVVKKAGNIEYYCRYHPNMVGQIEAGD
jgi:plastocyanin